MVTVEVAAFVRLAIGVGRALNAAVLRDEAVHPMHTIRVAGALHAYGAIGRTDGTVLRTGSRVSHAAGSAVIESGVADLSHHRTRRIVDTLHAAMTRDLAHGHGAAAIG